MFKFKRIYYLETNALYALSNSFNDIVDSKINTVTSIFALQEIVDGIDAKTFFKRKVLLDKVCTSKIEIYPYLPKECIATAFKLDVSDLPNILNEKVLLQKQIEFIRNASSFDEYQNKLESELGIDSVKTKVSDDEREQQYKRTISKKIEVDRMNIKKIKKEQKDNPTYVEIDINKAFGLEKSESDIDTNSYEAILLRYVLDSLHITYEEEDIIKAMIQRDKSALVAALLGNLMYSASKGFEFDKKLAGRNDVNDLIHLFYLRNENYIIVSDDKIFEISTVKDMRIKTNELLEFIMGEADKNQKKIYKNT